MRGQTDRLERIKASLLALWRARLRPAQVPPAGLADQTADLILRHAPDGRIRRASDASRALLGRAPAELEGLTPRDLVHPDDLPTVQALFREASYFGRPGASVARLRHAAGHHVWAELRCVGTPRADGDTVTALRDVGAWKAEADSLRAARDAAQEADRAKSRFLAHMSHELRTPLNAIIGFSEVMERQMFGPLGAPRYREYAGLVHESGSHLLDLINGLLDMAKIEAGRFELREEMFALNETVAGAAQIVQLAAQRGGIALTVDVADGIAQVFADRQAVKQMLLNLLSNAIKFTPPRGQVHLRVWVEQGALMLAVSDTGVGIAPADLARLGQPFVQAQGQVRQGTGLGLALVKSLASLHGGGMDIASRLGEGTCVTVRLPRAVMREALRGAA